MHSRPGIGRLLRIFMMLILIVTHLSSITVAGDETNAAAIAQDLKALPDLLEQARQGVDMRHDESVITLAVGYAAIGDMERACNITMGVPRGLREVATELAIHGDLASAGRAIELIDHSEAGKNQRYFACQDIATALISSRPAGAKIWLDDAASTLHSMKDGLNGGYWQSSKVRDVAALYFDLGEVDAALRLATDIVTSAKQRKDPHERQERLEIAAWIYARAGQSEAAVALSDSLRPPFGKEDILYFVVSGLSERNAVEKATATAKAAKRPWVRAISCVAIAKDQVERGNDKVAGALLGEAEHALNTIAEREPGPYIRQLTEVATLYSRIDDREASISCFQAINRTIATPPDKIVRHHDNSVFGFAGKAAVAAAERELDDVAVQLFSSLKALADREVGAIQRDLKFGLIAEYEAQAGRCGNAMRTIEAIQDGDARYRGLIQVIKCAVAKNDEAIIDQAFRQFGSHEQKLANGTLARAYLKAGNVSAAEAALNIRYGDVAQWSTFDLTEVARVRYHQFGMHDAREWSGKSGNAGLQSYALLGVVDGVLEKRRAVKNTLARDGSVKTGDK